MRGGTHAWSSAVVGGSGEGADLGEVGDLGGGVSELGQHPVVVLTQGRAGPLVALVGSVGVGEPEAVALVSAVPQEWVGERHEMVAGRELRVVEASRKSCTGTASIPSD